MTKRLLIYISCFIVIVVGIYLFETQQSKIQMISTENQKLLQQNKIIDEQLSAVQLKSQTVEPSPVTNQNITLPQVEWAAAAYYPKGDEDALQQNLVKPIIDYYKGAAEILLLIKVSPKKYDQSNDEYLIDMFTAKKDGSTVPGYEGFLWQKVNGKIPVWTPAMASDYGGE